MLACRTDEYATAVAAAGVLRATPVIELGPVDVDTAITWLRSNSPRAADAVRVRVDEEGTAGALAAALSTPLMVSLARTVFADVEGGRDPVELVDRVRLPDRAAIERHLLSWYVPVVYAENYRRRESASSSGLQSRRERVPLPWNPERATRWLSFLASRGDAPDWWRLRPGTIWRWASAATVGIVAGLAFGASGGDADYFGATAGISAGLQYGLVFAIVCGALLRMLRQNQVAGVRTPPNRVERASMAGLGMGLFCGLVATFVDEFVMAVGAGFMLGFVFRAFTGPANQQILSGRLSWPLDGLALGLVGWPVAVLVVGFPRGMSTGPLIGMPGPLSIAAERLRSGLLFGSLSDIGFGLLVGVALGLLCGLIGWLADALPHGPVRHRWVAVMSVVPMALLGGLLGGSMLGPAGELGFGVAGGFGFGAAASLVRLRNPEADLGGWRDAVVVNVTNRTRDGLVGGVLGGITGVLSAWLTGTVPSGMTTAGRGRSG